MAADPQLLARIDAYIDANLEERLADLGRLCAIPSVAAINHLAAIAPPVQGRVDCGLMMLPRASIRFPWPS